MNAGSNGWYDDAGTKKAGKFVIRGTGGAWEVVSSPVKLKLDGTPMDASIKVADGKTPATPTGRHREVPERDGHRRDLVDMGEDEDGVVREPQRHILLGVAWT